MTKTNTHRSLKFVHLGITTDVLNRLWSCNTEILNVVQRSYPNCIAISHCSAFNGIEYLRSMETEHGSITKICNPYTVHCNTKRMSSIVYDLKIVLLCYPIDLCWRCIHARKHEPE